MRGFLIKWAVNIIALVAVVNIVPGINVDRWQTTVITALIIGLINAFLKPFVLLYTLPLNIISLGLFTLVINGFMFYLVSKIINGFSIANFWNAFWGALLFSIISFLLNLFVSPKGRITLYSHKYKLPSGSKYNNVIDVEGGAEKDEETGQEGGI